MSRKHVVYLSGARATVREEILGMLRDARRGHEIPDYQIQSLGLGAAQKRAIKAAIRAATEKDHAGRPVADVLAMSTVAHEIAASLPEDFASPRDRDIAAALNGDPEALKRVQEHQERDRMMESLADEIVSRRNRR